MLQYVSKIHCLLTFFPTETYLMNMVKISGTIKYVHVGGLLLELEQRCGQKLNIKDKRNIRQIPDSG